MVHKSSYRRHALLMIWALLYLAPTHALLYHSTLLVNPVSGKKVLLLDDAHAKWIEKFGTDAAKSLHNNLYLEQKKQLNLFGNRLVSLDFQKGSRIVVLTETPLNAFGRMVEQEMGAAPIEDNNEPLEILPRIFLRSLTANLKTMDEKMAFVGTSKSFHGIQYSFGYALHNGLFWVLGDRRRTDLDLYLALTVYQKWQEIVQALDEQTSLLWKIKNCFGYCRAGGLADLVPGTEIVPTIAYVQRYLDDLHADFKKHGLGDSYYQRLSQFLNAELAAGHIVATDHIARLYAYLARNNRFGSLDGFNQDMLAFVSLKCDVEFREYAEAFNADTARKYMIVTAGGVHNFDIKNVLLNQGYRVDKELGQVLDPDLTDLRAMFSKIFDGAGEKPLDALDDIDF